ncbi:YdcH family protein [uncultured Roseibium sp.]|uniref:YdcH family protein n=1 Tax=uncultured Roseibium sp. TaxID=1936171 RepID=UPI00321686AF
MSHVPHELHEEFPEHADALHALKVSNAHFAKLSDDYHNVNREIHRIETDIEPASDDALEDLKKQRLQLKDEIAALLAASESTGS